MRLCLTNGVPTDPHLLKKTQGRAQILVVHHHDWQLKLVTCGIYTQGIPGISPGQPGPCSSQPLPNEKWPGQHGWWKKKIPANLVMKIKFRLFGDDYICLKGI